MSQLNAKLIVITGANAGQVLVLEGKPILIGRDPDCDLVLADGYASRQHCWIEQREGAWWVRDLGSKNGTWVGQEQVFQEQPLQDGDLLLVGHSQLRLEAPDGTLTYEAVPVVVPSHSMSLMPEARQVLIDEELVEPPLSPKQWTLLAFLYDRQGQVVTKDEIARIVWPEAEGAIYDYQIDKLVSRLRARLGPAGEDLIETHWGVGYMLRQVPPAGRP
jgi:hypothetical protein